MNMLTTATGIDMSASEIVTLVIGIILALTTLGGVVASVALAVQRVRSMTDNLVRAMDRLGEKVERSTEKISLHDVEIAKLWTTIAERLTRREDARDDRREGGN
jgi:hypothetical protein